MSQENNQQTAVVAYEPQKEAEPPKKEGYWGFVASRFVLIKRVLVIALILFLVFFIVCFSRAFTYDSLFSFVKDLQSVGDFVPSDYQTVSATYYEGEEVVLSYRGSIAFVNTKGIEIYSPDGGRLLDVEAEFQMPRAVASRKYLLAYDHGGARFTVTSAYSKLFSEEFTDLPVYDAEGNAIEGKEIDLAILGATVANTGHFAVITTSNRADALSLVWLYDNNFNLIQCFSRASATLDVAISENGGRIVLLGADADGGQVIAKADVFSLGSTQPDATLLFEGEVPLSVSFTNGQNVAILTDRALRFTNLRLEEKQKILLEGRPIVCFEADENGVVLALEENALTAEKRVLAFNQEGKSLLNDLFIGEIKALALEERIIFLLSGEHVVRYDADKGKKTSGEITIGATDIFAVNEKGVRVIYPAKAEYLKFD